jgi:uncharacterized protein YkwD
VKTIRLSCTLALAATALALAPTAVAEAAATDAMVAEINTARQARGLRPVGVSPALMSRSQAYAAHLLQADVFAHSNHLRVAGFRSVGEVLEMHSGTRAQVRGTLRSWLNSPGHRAVILSRRFRSVGMGRAAGRFGGMRATVWVGRFGG